MLRLPTHVQLEITDKCNLKCGHCYHFDTKRMPISQDLDDEMVINLVKMMVKDEIYSLIITGGEPFIRPDLVIKIAKIAKEAKMFVSVNTNALLVTPKIIEELKEIKINSLLVSCPAGDNFAYNKITQCGSYELFCHKLKIILDSGIPCMINMVVTPFNVNLIRKTAIEMSKLGVKRLSVTPASLNVEHPNFYELLDERQTAGLLEDLRWCDDFLGLEVDILEPLPKCFFPQWCWEKEYLFTRRICQAGRMSLSVSNIGDARPCSHNPIIYGNLFQTSLIDIWNKMDLYRKDVVPDICSKCPTESFCNGSCRTNSLATTGLLNQPDRFVVGHFDLSLFKKSNEILINDETLINFIGDLRWRKEYDSYYSITSKSSGNNLIVVNNELFQFVVWLKEHLPLSVKELSLTMGENSSYENFIKILKFLVKKEFLTAS